VSIFTLGAGRAPAAMGGKADAWVRLHAAGILVPDGFCIPAGVEVDAASVGIALGELRHRTGVRFVAVRSSGLGEDGAEMALAGLFESMLDVPADLSAVMHAIGRCRDAGSTQRAEAALGKAVEIGVLVQEMLAPERSGVLFTRDPVNGKSAPVVEVVRGHLRSLVDGSSAEAVRLVLGADCAVGDEVLPVEERDILLGLCPAVEAVVGGPADIEWGSVRGRIVVLQGRPITTRRKLAQGLTLYPVDSRSVRLLPSVVLQHDKIELRLTAERLGIGISAGFVGLAHAPQLADLSRAAEHIAAWGEFIAVLLDPFDLDGQIHRTFGTGPTAGADLVRFIAPLASLDHGFAFLLKELQDTAFTGVGLRLPDGGVHIEVIRGHFITKGFEEPRTYRLAADGSVSSSSPGSQTVEVQVTAGRKVRLPVSIPAALSAEQLSEIRRAAVSLATTYPDAGIEFGYTADGQFFLVDLYRSASVRPPERGDVLSEGRVIGRIRVLDVPADAIESSIERHIHSRRVESDSGNAVAEILVVSRPFHILDELVYRAAPGTLGFICDGGALLCHLAVVMRERGVPGLVSPGATSVFRDGERVVLDTRPGSLTPVLRI
jgi:phosphohistidine swiveling domain-containing protein